MPHPLPFSFFLSLMPCVSLPVCTSCLGVISPFEGGEGEKKKENNVEVFLFVCVRFVLLLSDSFLRVVKSSSFAAFRYFHSVINDPKLEDSIRHARGAKIDNRYRSPRPHK